MSVLALLCRTVVVVRITSTPANCIVTAQTTHFSKATVTADTLCVMLIEHVSHSWTHAELASVSVESDIARTTLRFVRYPLSKDTPASNLIGTKHACSPRAAHWLGDVIKGSQK
jgi:hypothetical protein